MKQMESNGWQVQNSCWRAQQNCCSKFAEIVLFVWALWSFLLNNFKKSFQSLEFLTTVFFYGLCCIINNCSGNCHVCKQNFFGVFFQESADVVRSFVGGLELVTNLLRSDDKQVACWFPIIINFVPNFAQPKNLCKSNST